MGWIPKLNGEENIVFTMGCQMLYDQLKNDHVKYSSDILPEKI